MRIGFIGIKRNQSLNIFSKGHEVMVYNRTKQNRIAQGAI